MAWTADGGAMSKMNSAFQGRMAHYFSNPVPLGRDAVNGYRSLPRHVQDNRAANFVAAPRYEKVPIFDRGSECQATWQGAKFGKANPRVSHKIGKDTSLTALQRAAEKARTLAACRRTYLDIRVVGKMRGKPDSSHPWAAYRAAQLGVYGAFDWPDWCSHYARAYGHLLAMVPDAPDYPDWINDSACIRLGRFKPRKTTVLPRTFMLFKEDKRNFWRRGCNEWMPANLLGEWREGHPGPHSRKQRTAGPGEAADLLRVVIAPLARRAYAPTGGS